MIIEKGQALSFRQVKQRIKELNKWTEARYQKELILIRRGLTRMGERHIKAQEFLFREVKAKARYKSDYKPTQYTKQVRLLGRIKGHQIRGGKRSVVKTKTLVRMYNLDYINRRFGALIRANKGAQRIYKEYYDNVYLLEQKLTEYANLLHAKIDEQDRVISAQAIPFSSEQYGSEVEIAEN